MTELKTNSSRLRAARRDTAKLIEQASPTTLLQLSIVGAPAICECDCLRVVAVELNLAREIEQLLYANELPNN